MSQLVRDVRFAIRSLRRRRAFALVAILTIALGIAAATSIYTVVDGVLLRPLPYHEAGQLVAVWQTYPGWKKEPILANQWDRIPLSIPEYRDLRSLRVFANAAVWARGAVTITEGERPELVSTTRASASLLDVLAERPLLGRMFLPSEDVPGGPHVVLVTYESWQSRFGGDRHILGRTVRLDDAPYTIIGVLPRGLTVGRQGASLLGAPVFWLPVGQDSIDYRERTNHSYLTVARLAAGVSLDRARVETSRLLTETATGQGEKGVHLAEWQGDQVRDARAPLLVLLGAAALLLGIACVNTATLSLGEAATREQEMATRLAIGAGRVTLIRQMLTESLLVALGGGALGVIGAAAGTRTLVALAPTRIPGLADVRMDLRVLAATLFIAVGTGVLFGLAPALVSAGTGLGALLRGGAGQSAPGRGALQRGLVALELALSVVLLVGAGLLTRSLEKITAVDPGFRADRLLVVRTSFPTPVATDSARVVRFYAGLATRLSALPGVSAVTFGSQPPFNGGSSSSTIAREGDEVAGAATGTTKGREAQQRIVVPGFFATLGIPLLAGRDFTVSDRAGAPNVAIVSDALARRDFPGESPLDKRVKYQGRWWTIVGVVGDVHYQKLTRDLEPTIYTPPAQRGGWSLQLLIRAVGEPASLTAALRAAIHEVEPRTTVVAMDDMRELIRRSSSEERYRTLLIALFGAFAIVLAAVGMYGVTVRAVARRTREVGIRLALGATAGRVVRLLVGSTLAGVIVGVGGGLLASLVASRFLAPFLFGIDATDPATYASIVALLALISVVASWVPARRAGRLEVAGVLRGE